MEWKRVSEELKAAVASKNIDGIRDRLWSCIVVDPNMSEKFAESLDYVLTHGISESELFAEDDGTPFNAESTKENFSELGGLFSVNFSKKKYEALKKIGETLYPPSPKPAEEEKKSYSQGQSQTSGRKTTAQTGRRASSSAGTFGGLAIGAVAGGMLGKLIIGSAAAVIGGLAIGAVAGALIGTAISQD